MLYTKTVILNSVTGFIPLSISLLSCISGLIASSVVSKRSYPHIDIAITYLLLVVAIFADTFALITQLFSQWTLRQLTKPGSKKLPKFVDRAISYWLDYRKMGKGITFMAQSSLL